MFTIIKIIILCLFAIVVNLFVCYRIRVSVRLIILLIYTAVEILGSICFLALNDLLLGFGFFTAMVWITFVSLISIIHYKKEGKELNKRLTKKIKEFNQERWIT